MSFTPVSYIGPYRLINIVYTGQVSQTWQAYDDKNRRPVAIKVLFQSAGGDRKQVSFVRWEYEVGKTLHSERIIQFYGIGKHGASPYIAMEWFSAPNIKQYMMANGYEKYCVVLESCLDQMTQSLCDFHDAGWVHCDVKPDNFLFSTERGVKLIDFALSRKIKPGFLSRLLNIKTQPQGTASYMSPEQIRGEPLDGRSDIYSLGCTFFEVLAGRPIYTGGNMNELLQKHVTGSVPSVLARNKNVTPEFGELIMTMLAKKTKDRPKTMSDVLSAIRRMRLFKRPPQEGDKIH